MIHVEDLAFSYTKAPFIRGMDFHIAKGEIFGFLGPSGAGKSTLQKILIGMLRAYSGSVKVNGCEVRRHDNRFYEQIGIDFEFPTFYEKLTARQNLSYFASLYTSPPRDPDALLAAVGLQHDADKKAGAYSKGMKSRLNFIKALVHDPALLFLDEPTSGLDPTNSRVVKDLILAEREKGKTILLTTHNMADAAELCDRVAFIVDGQIRALDTPHALMLRHAAHDLSYTYLDDDGQEHAATCALTQTGSDETLLRLVRENRLGTIHSREQTLGDVFMEVTGRQLT